MVVSAENLNKADFSDEGHPVVLATLGMMRAPIPSRNRSPRLPALVAATFHARQAMSPPRSE